MKISKLKKYILQLQNETDNLTERLRVDPEEADFDYFDGRNDALIEVLDKLKRVVL